MENDGYQEMGTCSRESFSVLPFSPFGVRIRGVGRPILRHTHTVQMGPLHVFFLVRFDRIYDIKTYSSDLDVLRNDELREHLDHVQMMHR